MSDVPVSDSPSRPRGLQFYTGYVLVWGLITILGMVSSTENFSTDDLNPAGIMTAAVYLLLFWGLAAGLWQRRRWARVVAILFHLFMGLGLIIVLFQNTRPTALALFTGISLVNLIPLIWLWRHPQHFGSRT